MADSQPEPTYSIVVDVRQRRPACVLIQAVYGGDSGALQRFMSSEDWLTFPTADMALVTGTKAQWERFDKELSARRKAAQ